MDFAIQDDHRVKLKESEKRDKYIDLSRELKKTMEHESDCDTDWGWLARYCYQMNGKGSGGLGNKEGELRPSKLQYCLELIPLRKSPSLSSLLSYSKIVGAPGY